jgi:hypothetical protein
MLIQYNNRECETFKLSTHKKTGRHKNSSTNLLHSMRASHCSKYTSSIGHSFYWIQQVKRGHSHNAACSCAAARPHKPQHNQRQDTTKIKSKRLGHGTINPTRSFNQKSAMSLSAGNPAKFCSTQ